MLQSLHIKNIALIDELEMNFSDGFHILTGETGAGKSIIIDSVNFVLGERSNRDLIQSGSESAIAEAAFTVDHSPALLCRLTELGIPHEAGDPLIITRMLTTAGKNTVRVNGVLLNLNTLKSITDMLVDIHGQHEHQSLLRQEEHIHFLDAYGKSTITPLKETTASAYHVLKKLEKEMHAGFLTETERAQRLDLLSYQIKEIERAKLADGEEEELEASIRVLSNAQQIRSALEATYESLAGEMGAQKGIGEARHQLDAIVEYHTDYEEIRNRLNDTYYAIEDITFSLRHTKDGVEFDTTLLREKEDRFSLIQSLKRKYGASIKEILVFLEKISMEYEALQQGEARREQLNLALSKAKAAYTKEAEKLTAARKEAATRLQKDICAELSDLGMEHALFEVAINALPSSSANGIDEVEFMLSTNKGEPAKPLQRVASGGELSRIMLAFKTIQFGNIPTIIFDEIDTGISGHIATAVGGKMLQIASGHQVLCVTHLPQIASMADIHYFVEKYEKSGHTYSTITILAFEERVRELARIMGASMEDVQAQKHAEELLMRAQKVKDSQK